MIPYIKNPAEKWQHDHNMALCAPVGIEIALTHLVNGWVKYVSRYEGLYHKQIGHDPILGAQWAIIGEGIRALLTGPTGRLDSETLDALIVATLEAQGFAG